MSYYLTISQCPEHPDFWSVSIDAPPTGTLVTPGKCCGRWREVKRWMLSSEEWRELVTEAECAAEAMEALEEAQHG